MVVAQLVERFLPIPEVRGSNPVIGKKYIEHFTVNCIENTKIKKKRPGRAQFLKNKTKLSLKQFRKKSRRKNVARASTTRLGDF